MLGSLNQYLIRISIFVLLILIVVVFLYPVLQTAFLSNIYINSIIFSISELLKVYRPSTSCIYCFKFCNISELFKKTIGDFWTLKLTKAL